jgi:hypothetical protein
MNKLMKKINLFGSIAAILIAILTLISPAHGKTIYENFDNNQYNQNLFSLTTRNGAVAALANNRLEVTIPAGASGNIEAFLHTNFSIAGDFEAQFDFNLLTWPANDGAMVMITAKNYDCGVEVGRKDIVGPAPYGGEKYRADLGGMDTFVPTGDTVGKLRIARTGNTWEGSYWDNVNNHWQSISTGTGSGLPTHLYIYCCADTGDISPFGGQTAVIAIDNLRITYNVPLQASLPLLLLE